jgi:hypothetical protein
MLYIVGCACRWACALCFCVTLSWHACRYECFVGYCRRYPPFASRPCNELSLSPFIVAERRNPAIPAQCVAIGLESGDGKRCIVDL